MKQLSKIFVFASILRFQIVASTDFTDGQLQRMTDLQCFVTGECSESAFVGENPVIGENECLSACKGNPSCLWWTFYPDSSACVLFANCNVLNATLCPNCVSGENGCAPRPTCWVEGQCEGRFLHLGHSDTKEDCLNVCKSNPLCQWFTWDSRDEACLQFRDCPSINPTCKECISGQRDCSIEQQSLKILIATGYGSKQTVEVIDLLGKTGGKCVKQQLPDFPTDLHGAVGNLHNGVSPMICGGFLDDQASFRNECHVLKSVGLWTPSPGLLNPVGYAGSSPSSFGWLITGGFNFDSKIVGSVDLLKETTWENLSEMPTPLYLHCMVNIFDDVFLVIGGMNKDVTFSKETHLFYANSKTWVRGPTLKYGRRSHSCSMLTHQDKRYVVVAGGENGEEVPFVSVELLEVDQAGQIISDWFLGPDLPSPTAGAVLVHDDVTGSTFLVGGKNMTDSQSLDTIFQLSLDDPGHWHQLQHRLTQGRFLHIAFKVPDSLFTCK